MPGRNLAMSMETSYSPNFALFKSHKVLPRRKVEPGNSSRRPLTAEYSRVYDEQLQATESAERIKSWIPEQSSISPVPDPDFPPTPPIITMTSEDEDWVLEQSLKAYVSSTQNLDDDMGKPTPAIERSPPTPEITPPKVSSGFLALAPPLSREPSLRTDSFETARENISSNDDDDDDNGDDDDDDEQHTNPSPSLHPGQQRWLRRAKNSILKDVGLGLELEFDDDEDSTATIMNPQISPKKYKLTLMDEESASDHDRRDHSVGLEQYNQGLAYLDPPKGLRREPQRLFTHPPMQASKVSDIHRSSPPRSHSLRQRIGKTRLNPTASMEEFARSIDWPLTANPLDIDARLREVDNRRLSQLSASSTVVEAVVIETPPQRRQTLRHSSKVLDLKSEAPQQIPSNRSSLISSGTPRRRLPRNSQSPALDQRRSVATDASGSITSSNAHAQHENPRATKAPESGRSILPRTSTIGDASASHSQHTPRPTTAPEEAIGYFDLPSRERRSTSIALPPSTLSKTEKWVGKGSSSTDAYPLLAPVHQGDPELSGMIASTAASVVSAPSQVQPVLQLSDPVDINGTSLDPSRSGEWSALRPRSALVTPFSVRSARSSTPGTLELSEATAISIYPHTNKSILVIQQLAPRDSGDPPGHSAIIAGNANIALPIPVVPAPARQALDSPLQNPREPPQPPDLKLIPPTPANASTAHEKSPRQSPTRHRLSGPVSLVKRAFSARRYSDSFVSPISPSRSRRSSSHPPSVGDDPDNKLHPFWRPRGFWDDLSDDSDSDSEFGNSGVLAGGPVALEQHHLQHNLPSSSEHPHHGRLSRSTSLSRRIAYTLNLSQGRTRRGGRTLSLDNRPGVRLPNSTRKSSASRPSRSYELIQPGRMIAKSESTVSGMGSKVQFAGFKKMAEKMEVAKARWEEGRREKAREKLRGRIGIVKLPEGGLGSGRLVDPRR